MNKNTAVKTQNSQKKTLTNVTQMPKPAVAVAVPAQTGVRMDVSGGRTPFIIRYVTR